MIEWIIVGAWAACALVIWIAIRHSSAWHSHCWMGLHKWLYIDERRGGRWCPLCGKVKEPKEKELV
jgi:hypothetical protein